MAEVDWSRHTADEVWRAADTMPKVAGAWREAGYGDHKDSKIVRWTRNKSAAATVFSDGTYDTLVHPWDWQSPRARTVEEAKAACDAALRAAGWLLVEDDNG